MWRTNLYKYSLLSYVSLLMYIYFKKKNMTDQTSDVIRLYVHIFISTFSLKERTLLFNVQFNLHYV